MKNTGRFLPRSKNSCYYGIIEISDEEAVGFSARKYKKR